MSSAKANKSDLERWEVFIHWVTEFSSLYSSTVESIYPYAAVKWLPGKQNGKKLKDAFVFKKCWFPEHSEIDSLWILFRLCFQQSESKEKVYIMLGIGS